MGLRQVVRSPLFALTLLLIAIGLVQIYSASYAIALEDYGDGLYFFYRQLAFAGLAVTVMLMVAITPWRWIERWGAALWIFASLLLLATFIPGLGVRVGGALRWIQLPLGLRFEPSELLKLAFVFLFASLLFQRKGSHKDSHKDSWVGKVHPLAWVVLFSVPMLLLLRQPDFGSFAIICALAGLLLVCFGLKKRAIFLLTAFAIPVVIAVLVAAPYRRARLISFLDPWSDPESKGFQVIRSLMTFSNGGLTGEGLGQGQGKLFFLPEAHTDFTLAVFAEEMGFLGIFVLFALFAYLLLTCFRIALKTENLFSRCVVVGVGSLLFLHFLINSGVVLGLLPTKGLTLPFLSYGGSSLLVLALGLGLVLNVEAQLVKSEEQ